jgi:uncharacterized protein YceK
MSLKLHGLLSAVALATLALSGCQSVQEQVAPNTLVAAKATSAPNLAALASDQAWSNVRPLTVELNDGKNLGGTGKTRVTLKALYTGDMLYMLVQYPDPTNSLRRIPYQKQADGSWKKITDPADKGGDENLNYEDKWAMIWPIDNSIKGFEEQGCAVVCHTGQGKPYGNKYTPGEGQIGDMWHMKSARTIPWGQIDDQYVDHTRYDAKASPNAGRKSDPGNPEGDYNAIPLVNGKPQFMNKDGKAANAGGTYWVKRGDEVPFVDNFKPGDEVASHIANQLKGDRADIKAVKTWENGVSTTVLSRKLVTGSKFDVQFDPAKRYPFGIAVFDNAAVRHATPDDALFMVFGK